MSNHTHPLGFFTLPALDQKNHMMGSDHEVSPTQFHLKTDLEILDAHRHLHGDPTVPELYSSEEKRDPVDHPPHYNSHPSGVECIDVIEWFTLNVGNCIKYLWRAGLKDVSPEIEDLKKARWYIDREISRLEKIRG